MSRPRGASAPVPMAAYARPALSFGVLIRQTTVTTKVIGYFDYLDLEN